MCTVSPDRVKSGIRFRKEDLISSQEKSPGSGLPCGASTEYFHRGTSDLAPHASVAMAGVYAPPHGRL